MPSIQSVQKAHETYRSAMDAKNSHHGASFRRAEALSKASKKDDSNQMSSSFKEILSVKMNQK